MPPRCCWPMPAPPRVRMRSPRATRPPSRASRPRCTLPAQPPIGAKPINIDPELLTLYIEEAREEVARIAKLFPAWEQNPLETDALAGVRRAFHTLKGSGRMVGATDIAEFAWSIENLLNKIIENTLQRSPSILATIRDASAMAGELVNALEAGQGAPAKVQDIIDRAHALAANRASAGAQTATMEILERTLETRRDDVVSATSRVPTLQPPNSFRGIGSLTVRAESSMAEARWKSSRTGPRPRRKAAKNIVLSAPEEEPSADMQLRDIYSRETQVNIAAVTRFIEGERSRNAPHVISEEAYRACHTLSGSSRMAEARHGIRLTAPLEHWVRKSFDSGVGLEADELNLLADCMNAMQSVASHLDESTGFFHSHSALLTRIDQATENLEQRIVAAARAAELASEPAPAPSPASPVSVAPAVAAPPASFPPVAPTPPVAPLRSSPGRRRRPHGFRP